MNILNSKDKRQYVASGIFIIMILALLCFLTFIEIPTTNKDLIVSIISMFVGGLGVAMGKLFGNDDAEIDALRAELNQLKVEHNTLKHEYDNIVKMLVERHVVDGRGICDREN